MRASRSTRPELAPLGWRLPPSKDRKIAYRLLHHAAHKETVKMGSKRKRKMGLTVSTWDWISGGYVCGF